MKMVTKTIGQTITDQVGWEVSVPSGTAKFSVISIYGHDTNGTVQGFKQMGGSYITVTTGSSSRVDKVLYKVSSAFASGGSYDAITIIGTPVTNGQIRVYAYKIDKGVLTIGSSSAPPSNPSTNARIISTSFY